MYTRGNSMNKSQDVASIIEKAQLEARKKKNLMKE
jgi:hypothetical protein